MILDCNIVHTAPGDVDFAKLIAKVDHTIYLGLYDDETAEVCDWSLPMAHPLESWGDCLGPAGHYGVCQPQILPLLGGRTPIEVLANFAGESNVDAESIVRRTADEINGTISDRQWRQLLHDGFAEKLTAPAGEFTINGTVDLLTVKPLATSEIDKDLIEVLFTPSESVHDGRFANNAWLQEMPQAITKLVWDNAALMSPRTARALDVHHGVKVTLQGRDELVELPVYELPGCAPGVVSVAFGYGRTRAGVVGGLADKDIDSIGVDVRPLRTADAMRFTVAKGRPRFDEYELVTTQDHWAIDELGRDETIDRSFKLIREGTTALLEKLPEFADAKGPHVPAVGPDGSLWEEPLNFIEEHGKPFIPQWGMSVDLTKCLGCNACVIACQAENNVPVVGKEQVSNSREMHWLRIDRYFQADISDDVPESELADNADVVQEPVACMHCETAPCEQVCPVAATVHTNEGINAMAYNRCIGTRYCANNCPYKVRRFNYFNYNQDVGVGYGWSGFPAHIEKANRKLQQLVLNDDVTVRGRGVMEKCTYCTQRVEAAKINARRINDGRVVDGDVVTACQAACPTGAIEFGNIADKNSRVSKAKEDPRTYGMLEQLNVKPRTSYMARIRNTQCR